MKNIAAIIFTLLVLIACSKEKTETVMMGSKDSELLEIKNFSDIYYLHLFIYQQSPFYQS